MIKAMLPLAYKAEAEGALLEYGATSSAIASAFSKNGGRSFVEALTKMTGRASSASRSDQPKKSTADTMLSALRKMGVAVPSVKGKGAKR